MKFYSLILLSVLVTFLCFSCSREPGPDPIERITDSLDTVITSVEGSVVYYTSYYVDPTGIIVKCGDQQITLDQTGYFNFQHVSVNKDLVTLTLLKNDFWPIVKSFVPNPLHNFINIDYDGSTHNITNNNFSAGSASTLQFSAGRFTVQPNSFTLGDPNTVYTGQGKFGYELNNPLNIVFPSGILYGKLPGNFLAEDDAGNIVGLQMVTSFFSESVSTSSGQKLYLLKGKKISINMPSDFSLSAKTPPFYLYFFDEKKGLWKQSGTATFDATGYHAESDSLNRFLVFAHPFEVIKFSGKIVGQDNSPVYSQVRINKVGESNVCFAGYSNNNGEIQGYIPKNMELELNLVQPDISHNYDYGYKELIFNKKLGNFSSTANLGYIVCYNMGDTVNRAIASYKGRVVDCNNNPVEGAIVSDDDLIWKRYPVLHTNANGEFNVTYTRNKTILDGIYFKRNSGNDRTRTLSPGVNFWNSPVIQNLGNIVLCNNNINEFVKFTIDGQIQDFRPPATLLKYSMPTTGHSVNSPYTTNEQVESATGNLFSIGFESNYNAGVRPINSFLKQNVANVLKLVDITVTENRNMGSYYLAGNFKGLIVKYTDGTVHTMDCEFRIKN